MPSVQGTASPVMMATLEPSATTEYLLTMGTGGA
jgi:hypothetical protein